MRIWALWRRLIYGTGFLIVLGAISTGGYYLFAYETPTCFDGLKNGIERGLDCGGSCTRICSFDIISPKTLWVRPFRVSEGLYNVVAYIENRNLNVGAPELHYTVALYDAAGLIVEKENTTVLPPDSVYPIFEGRIATGDRIPTQAFIELETETLWLPATAGREQFTIEKRELKDADHKPRLTASLKNTSLDEAKDVEVVATVFDVHGTALTSSRTVIPYFKGRSTEDVTFTWQEPIAKTVRSCEIPTDVVLSIDLSGSMNNDGGDPPEPVSSVLTAAHAFAKRLQSQDQGGVVTYATDAVVAQPLTSSISLLADTVAQLSISPEAETGGTNIGDSLYRSFDEFQSERHNPDARKVLVLLTDGLATEPGETPEDYALEAAALLHATGVEVFTIGLGAELNDAFLKRIASDEAHYFFAPNVAALDRIYRSITGAVCEDGVAVIEIIPKTSASFTPLQ